jgi:hypothetical protein
MTCLVLDKLAVHHYMDQATNLAVLPAKVLQRQFAEDRDLWLKSLYGRHLENDHLRQNTTSVTITDLSLRASGTTSSANKSSSSSSSGFATPGSALAAASPTTTADVILLRTNYEAYHLPPDTPAVHLEFSTFHRHSGVIQPGAPGFVSQARPGDLGGFVFALPPPCLFARIHPLQV